VDSNASPVALRFEAIGSTRGLPSHDRAADARSLSRIQPRRPCVHTTV
jgi:hypothetical protein